MASRPAPRAGRRPVCTACSLWPLAGYAVCALVLLHCVVRGGERRARGEAGARTAMAQPVRQRAGTAAGFGIALSAPPPPPWPSPSPSSTTFRAAKPQPLPSPARCCSLGAPRSLTPVEVQQLEDGNLPVVIVQTVGGTSKRAGRVACDVPCRLEVGAALPASARPWVDVVLAQSIAGVHPRPLIGADAIAGLKRPAVMSMESPVYYSALKVENIRAEGSAALTVSRDADVPVTYLRNRSVESWGTRPPAWDAARLAALDLGNPHTPIAVLVASNCASRSGREAWFKDLRVALGGRADSLGRCDRTKPWPTCPRADGAADACSKQGALRHYPFYLAAENSAHPDYVTEKVFDGLEAGVVPVYRGAPNGRDYLPEGSVIFADDFANASALAEHLLWLLRRPDRYLRLLEWKKRPLDAAFVRRWAPLVLTKAHCRLCRWAYAQRHQAAGNVTWSEEEQQLTIVPNHSSRTAG